MLWGADPHRGVGPGGALTGSRCGGSGTAGKQPSAREGGKVGRTSWKAGPSAGSWGQWRTEPGAQLGGCGGQCPYSRRLEELATESWVPLVSLFPVLTTKQTYVTYTNHAI